MAESQQRPPPSYQEPQHGEGILAEKGPSTSQVLAFVTLLPLGSFLLFLAGSTLVVTLIGLAATTPLFVICNPASVPAAIVLGLAVIGFLASGAFEITALSSLSWMLNYLRRLRRAMPAQQVEHAKRRVKWDRLRGQEGKQEGGRS